jgi:hypothetical protein
LIGKPKSPDAKARAEASFKKKEEQAREGAKAAAEYEANILAVREKTARLRALRLAQAAERAIITPTSSPSTFPPGLKVRRLTSPMGRIVKMKARSCS